MPNEKPAATALPPRARKGPPVGNRWPKGVSGNPSGMPKGISEIRKLARQYTEEAIEALVGALSDKSASVRVRAAEALLDRGWGRPAQALDVAVTPGTYRDVADMPRGELLAIIGTNGGERPAGEE